MGQSQQGHRAFKLSWLSKIPINRDEEGGSCGGIWSSGENSGRELIPRWGNNAQNGNMAWYVLEKVNSPELARTTFIYKIWVQMLVGKWFETNHGQNMKSHLCIMYSCSLTTPHKRIRLATWVNHSNTTVISFLSEYQLHEVMGCIFLTHEVVPLVLGIKQVVGIKIMSSDHWMSLWFKQLLQTTCHGACHSYEDIPNHKFWVIINQTTLV